MRIHDPAIVNGIAASIADRLGGLFEFDEPMANPKNIFLHDGGVAACIWSAPRIFECHLLYPPEVRGKAAVEASRRMGDYMLTYHADLLWGQPPTADRAAIWHIRKAGFEECGTAMNEVVGPVTYFRRAKCRQ